MATSLSLIAPSMRLFAVIICPFIWFQIDVLAFDFRGSCVAFSQGLLFWLRLVFCTLRFSEVLWAFLLGFFWFFCAFKKHLFSSGAMFSVVLSLSSLVWLGYSLQHFMGFSRGSWRFLKVLGGSWRFLEVIGSFWAFLKHARVSKIVDSCRWLIFSLNSLSHKSNR